MRKKEVDLIAALAEGKLEDETAARALVASSPKHQAEYEAQKTAYEALSSIPSAQLTEHESAALHRDIWTEFQAQPEAETTKAPWFYSWSYAAAGLFVVVGLVFVINQGGSSDQSAVGESFSDIGEGLDNGGDVGGSSATIQAATRAQEGTAADDAASAPTELSAADRDDLADIAAKTRSGELESVASATLFSTAGLDEHNLCIESAGLADHEAVGEVEVENHYIVAVPAGAEPGPDTPVSFVDINTCQVAYTYE